MSVCSHILNSVALDNRYTAFLPLYLFVPQTLMCFPFYLVGVLVILKEQEPHNIKF